MIKDLAMNLLDVIIICTMIFLIVRGIRRGFFREVASLAGVILGIWLANLFQPRLSLLLRPYVSVGRFLPIFSFATIFLVVLLTCNLAGWGLKELLNRVFLGWADRGLGAALAILKGVILTYLVIVLLTFFVPAQTPLIARSRLAPVIVSSYQSAVTLISPEAYQRWKRKWIGGTHKAGKDGRKTHQGTL